MHVDFIQAGFVLYKDKVILLKIEVIPHITDSMICMDFCQNKLSINNFTTDDMTPKYECFSKKKMNYLYITESL